MLKGSILKTWVICFLPGDAFLAKLCQVVRCNYLPILGTGQEILDEVLLKSDIVALLMIPTGQGYVVLYRVGKTKLIQIYNSAPLGIELTRLAHAESPKDGPWITD
ncbi:hypothetical protein HG530_001885 [Fusarium avenaceum]|nr:hypothetical protein HG530_001885 [Fusarium avenaceum]